MQRNEYDRSDEDEIRRISRALLKKIVEWI